MANLFDKDGNILDVKGSVNIVRQLTSGVPIAKINNIQLYAPQGGGGGDLSPLPEYTLLNFMSVVEGRYIKSDGTEASTESSSYVVYDVANIEGTILVRTYLANEGKYTCFGYTNGSVSYRGSKIGVDAENRTAETTDIIDVGNIDTIKVNVKKAGIVSVYLISSTSASQALNEDYEYLNVIAPSDKKGLFFGDSIVQGTGSFYGANAVKFAQNILRADCFNLGIGGGKMSRTDASTKDFHNVLDGVLDDNWSVVNPEIEEGTAAYAYSKKDEYARFKEYKNTYGLFNIDFVFICYGFNDWYTNRPIDNEQDATDVSTILGALRSAISRLYSALPYAKIYVATPSYAHYVQDGQTIDTDINANQNNDYLFDIGDRIEEVCKDYHIPCLNQYRKNQLNSYNRDVYLADGIHRTVAGYRLLGEQYAKFIMSH